MVTRYLAVITIALLLSGCALFDRNDEQTTTRVDVPIATDIDVPEELQGRYQPESIPEFIDPSHPDAVVALDREGIEQFQFYSFDILSRIRLWEATFLEETIDE